MPFVLANDVRLFYDTFGDASASPLLLIMGLGEQMIAWDDEFCTALAARGYRVIRFDNRDIGGSEYFDRSGVPNMRTAFNAFLQGRPINAPYRLEDMAEDVIGLLDALRIDRAHIVGASMGGAIGQTLAIHHAPRVLTLTSIMGTTGAPGLPLPTSEALSVLFKPVPVDRTTYIENYRQTWKVLRAGSFPLDEAQDLARAERNYARGVNPPGVVRQLIAILASGSRKEALKSVHVPTLVIHGDIDPLVPLGCGVDTARERTG